MTSTIHECLQMDSELVIVNVGEKGRQEKIEIRKHNGIKGYGFHGTKTQISMTCLRARQLWNGHILARLNCGATQYGIYEYLLIRVMVQMT